MGKRAVAAVAGEMWEPAFGAGFQAPRANQESQVSYSSRPPAACHFHSKAANSAHFLRNRIFGLPDGLKSLFSRKPPKMHPSSDSCAVPFFLTVALSVLVIAILSASAVANQPQVFSNAVVKEPIRTSITRPTARSPGKLGSPDLSSSRAARGRKCFEDESRRIVEAHLANTTFHSIRPTTWSSDRKFQKGDPYERPS